MFFLFNFFTAIALSLDAFSLSIIYGTIIQKQRTKILTSMIVGSFHFIMPLLGSFFGSIIIPVFSQYTNIISFMIFMFLGIEMFFSKDDKQIIYLNSKTSLFLFGFTVSIDSFSIGITLSNNNILLPISLFSIVSFIFTYCGLFLGNKLGCLLGKYTTKLGGSILFVLSFVYLFT